MFCALIFAMDAQAQHELQVSTLEDTVTRDAEWDTAAEINATTADDDFVQDGDIGSTVQAHDADLDT